jgi:hypothetical protein
MIAINPPTISHSAISVSISDLAHGGCAQSRAPRFARPSAAKQSVWMWMLPAEGIVAAFDLQNVGRFR